MTHSIHNAGAQAHLRIVVTSIAMATVVAVVALNIGAVQVGAGATARAEPVIRASHERAYSQQAIPEIW